MVMKIKTYNLFNNIFTGRYLLAILSILFIASCENEDEYLKESFYFQDYSFSGNIECYDTLGNRFDSLSYRYSQNQFIFSDDFKLPYEKAEIYWNKTMTLFYKDGDIRKGRILQKNDTLYFYLNDSDTDHPFLKGLLDNNQLRIPGYGRIYYTSLSNRFIKETHEDKLIRLGIPDLEILIQDFPTNFMNDVEMDAQNLYLQRFDLVYTRRVD